MPSMDMLLVGSHYPLHQLVSIKANYTSPKGINMPFPLLGGNLQSRKKRWLSNKSLLWPSLVVLHLVHRALDITSFFFLVSCFLEASG